MQYPWGHNKRYNAYVDYFRREFGSRVQKISINAGSTCPNRDGSLGTGGCTFCNNDAFNPSYCIPELSITQQLDEGSVFHKKRYKTTKFIAYFQAYSNTYGDFEKLKTQYEEALRYPDLVGIVIGTRPDCIDQEKLEYFKKLSEKHYIIIEYGVESVYNKTLEKINRGHSFEKSVEAIEMTADMGLKTGAHMIFGLPGESHEEMLASAEILSKLPLNNIKFHQLQIITDTAMGKDFIENPDQFNLFEMDDYVNFIVQFIERLNPEFVIERFSGESPPRFILNKKWGPRSDEVARIIESRFEELDTWQGKLFNV
ncbi:MAG: TIGR01212 family radical SAM protein [Bacteroidales bacterium]|nr:TIGR01212 family radical SAM protein [Bacteroidales bacterium]